MGEQPWPPCRHLPVTLTPLLFFEYAEHILALEPLHWLFPLLGTLFPQIPTWLNLFHTFTQITPSQGGLS